MIFKHKNTWPQIRKGIRNIKILQISLVERLQCIRKNNCTTCRINSKSSINMVDGAGCKLLEQQTDFPWSMLLLGNSCVSERIPEYFSSVTKMVSLTSSLSSLFMCWGKLWSFRNNICLLHAWRYYVWLFGQLIRVVDVFWCKSENYDYNSNWLYF